MTVTANGFGQKPPVKIDRDAARQPGASPWLELRQREDAAIHLSPRETQIVVLVADGLPNKDIALNLGISEGTVVTHLRRIFVKFAVNSRAAMVYRYAMMHAPRTEP